MTLVSLLTLLVCLCVFASSATNIVFFACFYILGEMFLNQTLYEYELSNEESFLLVTSYFNFSSYRNLIRNNYYCLGYHREKPVFFNGEEKKIIVNATTIPLFNCNPKQWIGNMNDMNGPNGNYFSSIYNLIASPLLGPNFIEMDFNDIEFCGYYANLLNSLHQADITTLLCQYIMEQVITRFAQTVAFAAGMFQKTLIQGIEKKIVTVEIDEKFVNLVGLINESLQKEKLYLSSTGTNSRFEYVVSVAPATTS